MAMAIAMPAAASTKSPIIRSPTRSQMDEADHDPYFSLLQSEAADPSRNPSAADPSEFPSPADPSEPPSEDPSADPSANPSGYVSEDPSQQPAKSPPFGEICSNRFDPTTVDGIQTEIHESSALHESTSACKNQLSNDTIDLAAMPSSPSSSSSPTGYVRGKAPHSHAATSIHKGAGIGKKKSLSPILRWFPRKKTESFLERKIRMLQVCPSFLSSETSSPFFFSFHLAVLPSSFYRSSIRTSFSASEFLLIVVLLLSFSASGEGRGENGISGRDSGCGRCASI